MKEDRISQLPDDLICQILSHLPTKDAVRTSVLSTRWTNLWLWLPRLKLSFVGIGKYYALSLANRFFDSNRVSCIDKLKLTFPDVYSDIVDGASYLTSWIDAAVKRRIQHLDVKCHVYNIYRFEIPLSLYMCETLVSLKLDKAAWDNAEFVSFPCLKTMHLHNNFFPNEAAFEALVSCCPVLEELEITGFEVLPNVHKVQSQSLKRLTIRRITTREFYYYVPELVIDAPLLCGLGFFDAIANIIITNILESIAKLDVILSFGLKGSDGESVSSKRSNIRSFLSKISRVMDMTISSDTLKVIHQYSKLEPLPQFGYISRLCLDNLHASEVKWLTTTFLESCPNLKSLVLAPWDYESDLRSEEINQISFSSVPKCLLSSLESVDLKFSFLAEGYALAFQLGKYFLENSVVLKKFNLHLLYHPRRDDIFEKFLRFPRGSTECEVVVESY
ncbi:PREDICTED: putative FBD-associated F-box protein At5g53635 [Camelina sativa]|uniref:FBD-associated F-box protein At5g53635 n=1 Tax=Camelina sativa TaxID=90675 RepID=A0ABM1R478_CAMSA|nr:PREDICTED: putative FBD-associated F-box protein At5g53635 [Camelina sativa]